MRSMVVAVVVLLVTMIGCQQSGSAPISAPTPEVTDTPDWLFKLPIYEDNLSGAWSTQSSVDVELDREGLDFVYAGNNALAVYPESPNNMAMISVNSNAEIAYPLNRLEGFELWLNPGHYNLLPADFIIGILGSEGARLEIPLAQLATENELPASQWVHIKLVFSQMALTLPDPALAGIYLRHNNAQPYFIDNFSLLAKRDDTPPTAQQVEPVGNDAFRITFSEEMDIFSVSRRSSYTINQRHPDKVEYDAGKRQATLYLNHDFAPNVTYSVTIVEARDAGFPMNPLIGDASFNFTPNVAEAPTFSSAPPLETVDHYVTIYLNQARHPISPYIYGVSGADETYLEALQPTLNRWGGNENSRYNWQLGNAWNAARDWEYRNTAYEFRDAGNVADTFLQTNDRADVASLLTIPTIGWVAKDTESCSFPLPDGNCGTAQDASCENPASFRPDPTAASVEAPPEFMTAWVTHLKEMGVALPFLALGNEPELWGITHYDVHPDCSGYDEIYERFAQYAAPIKTVSPESQIVAPGSCCWWFYWSSLLGTSDWAAHDGVEFIPWFLQQAAKHEEETGQRILDVLDIHYYPEGLNNDDIDDEIAARRLRSTRSLYDPVYNDESWINEPMQVLTRMKWTIAGNYPDTRLSVSEWRWGAEGSMNGALAIADVLGIFGREDLYMAAHDQGLEYGSPGYFAFKMYTNYDDEGSAFGGTSVKALAEDQSRVSVYAAHDEEDGEVHLMLINKQPEQGQRVQVFLEEYGKLPGNYDLYQYSEANLEEIVHHPAETPDGVVIVDIPPYSISLLVLSE